VSIDPKNITHSLHHFVAINISAVVSFWPLAVFALFVASSAFGSSSDKPLGRFHSRFDPHLP
ncbi:MAG: hypothetical protein WA702_01950, partial [Bradyrhizobium sp.]|uniref:hypothetical protein n=1 Tax=Bradyrhizobium sp. TaxID=376 RepID=UPI003C7E836D